MKQNFIFQSICRDWKWLIKWNLSFHELIRIKQYLNFASIDLIDIKIAETKLHLFLSIFFFFLFFNLSLRKKERWVSLTFLSSLEILSPYSNGVTQPRLLLQSSALVPLVIWLLPGIPVRLTLLLSGFFLRNLLNASTRTNTASYISAACA